MHSDRNRNGRTEETGISGGAGMKESRLNNILNWEELAQKAEWSVAALAKQCTVSVRTLHRHFLMRTGKSTKNWLAEQRQRRALELLRLGSSIKETAYCLGYQQPANFTRKNHFSATRWIWKRMKKRADLDPKDQKPIYFEKVRELMLDSTLSQKSVELYSKAIREYLTLLIPFGLDPACVSVFKKMPKKPDSDDRGGEPFSRTHLQTLFTFLASASELIQVLVWIGLSGAPQIIDAVFLPFAAINWKTGIIYYQRVKTGEKIKFCAMPPLLRLLRNRYKRLGPGAVYVFPELIFTQEEQRMKRASRSRTNTDSAEEGSSPNPYCNTADFLKGWKVWQKVPERTRSRASGYGMIKIAGFLTHCGIKTHCGLPTDDLTFKSFRQHHISCWSSLGIKLSVRMLMAGHSKKDNHGTYDIPTDDELIQAKNITWSYLKAVKKGKPFFVPTCQYEIYLTLMRKWDLFPEIMRAMVANELKGTFDQLRQLTLDCASKQCANAEKQTAILQAENAKLMEQILRQDGRLQAILDGIVKLSAFLGFDLAKHSLLAGRELAPQI
jgi:AraC-like DNA-binding protein